MSKKDKEIEWYFCSDCNRYMEREEAIRDHVNFYHSVKRRTPLEKRMIHTTSGKTLHRFVVDNNEWFVAFRLVCFNEDRSTAHYRGVGWKFNSIVGLSGELQQICDKLNHLNPYQKITVNELESLVEDSIHKGTYEERGTNGAQILLCLSTDVELVPRNETSRWICITRSQLRRLIRDEPDSLREAYSIAEKSKM